MVNDILVQLTLEAYVNNCCRTVNKLFCCWNKVV